MPTSLSQEMRHTTDSPAIKTLQSYRTFDVSDECWGFDAYVFRLQMPLPARLPLVPTLSQPNRSTKQHHRVAANEKLASQCSVLEKPLSAGNVKQCSR